MNKILSFYYCILALPLFSQNKLSENELKRFEWIVYNKHVDDSSEIFSSDTLLLVKSYELESLTEIVGEDQRKIDELYPRCWHLDFSLKSLETSDQSNEFLSFFIDLRKAALSRSMEVDSITYHLLEQDPNTFIPKIAPIFIELQKMQIGDVIQIVDSLHNQFYYLQKTEDKIVKLTTLNRRYIIESKGLNDGFWSFSKGKQLMSFSDNTRNIEFLFRVESIDKKRIRLIRIDGILR